MAANGLNAPTSRWGQLPEKLVTLLLFFVLLTAAIAGVTSVLTGPDWGALWRGLTFGLLIGWALALLQQPALRSALITTLLAASYALLYAGGLRQKLAEALNELIFVTNRLIRAPRDPGLDLRAVTGLLGEAFSTMGVVIERVRAWVLALVGGEPAFDPVAVAFVWIVLVWFVAAWAGWVAIARRDALLAVLPALLLSVGALSYGRRESFSLYLMLGATLLLLATLQHVRREQGWDETDTAYPPKKGRQIGNAVFILSAALVLFSAFASTVSLARVVDWVSTHAGSGSQGEGSLIESLGIVAVATATPDAFEEVRRPGLPQDRLIGSGPELSKRPVMSVVVEDFPAIFSGVQPQPLYWRSFTYDVYTGHGWRTSDTTSGQYPANELLGPGQASQHISITQAVHPVSGESRIVYAAGEPFAVNRFSDAAWRSTGDLFGLLIDGAGSYETRSLISVASETALRAERQDYPGWVRQRYLSLPPDLPGRVKELALQLTASEPTPYDRVRAIERYLRTIPYTLDVPYPPSDQDLVDFFLFDLRKGYCDYYASAMVVLTRAAGVPARFVTGYANGTYDLNSKRFRVSEADAHSWVEAYFPEAGWVAFEPTAGRTSLEKPTDSGIEVGSNSTFTGEPTSAARSGALSPGWLLLIGFIASIGVVFAARVILNEFRLQRLAEPAAAIEVYRRMRRYGAQLAVAIEPGDTPYEYAAALRARLHELSHIWAPPLFKPRLFEDIASITESIVETSYRPSPAQDKSKYLVTQQWKGLRWQLGLMRLSSNYQSWRDRLWGSRLEGLGKTRAGDEAAELP